MRRPRSFVRAVAAAMLLAAAGSAIAATHVVTITQMSFGTMPRDVNVGDLVEWRNADVVPHTATAQGAFDVVLAPGESATTRIDRPGTLEVRCLYHPGMSATLDVD